MRALRLSNFFVCVIVVMNFLAVRLFVLRVVSISWRFLEWNLQFRAYCEEGWSTFGHAVKNT